MKQTVLRLGGIALAMFAFLSMSVAIPQLGQKPEAVFDPAAKARVVIGDATTHAAKKNRRVLIVWGHDAREGDVELHKALRGTKIGKFQLYYEYELTPIDCGAKGETNAELAKALGAHDLVAGPGLTVLDGAGKPLANKAAEEFRSEDGWDSAKLASFLGEHIAEPQDAEEVMKRALEQAKKHNKRLFVHLGAPW